jgi:hypothetical protein
VTAHLGGGWNDVDVEQVLTWNPDLVLVPPYGRASVEAIVEDPEWQLLNAVRPATCCACPSWWPPGTRRCPTRCWPWCGWPRTLHGELTGLDCAGETTFFYRRFYDYGITPDEVAALCSAERRWIGRRRRTPGRLAGRDVGARERAAAVAEGGYVGAAGSDLARRRW